MKRSELIFERPAQLAATTPAEARGVERDSGRLLISTPAGHTHAQFNELASFLRRGDLLVVNDSATLPASLPARGAIGAFIVNIATDYGGGTWLVEPRQSSSQPGALPLSAGDRIVIGADDGIASDGRIAARLIAPYPGLPRLWFIVADGDLRPVMAATGAPIRYGYVSERYPLSVYQTVFANRTCGCGSAEMPSAAYPFTRRVVDSVQDRGVEIVAITLHTGVSSLEVESETVEQHPLYPEPFAVSAATAQAVNTAHASGRRVIAIGTTVVRALESAWDGNEVHPARGFTRAYIHPARGVHVVDGVLTGLHDPVTSHLAMLYAIAGQDVIRAGYAEAVRAGYLWHEFGDSHLIMTR
ncbi:MAG: S-adenosylmethionine:tRNA ribosyltransferase-isomerase [Chloroflexota bacterium]|nr:S-adenosylmethionine:tRNA ribosyltransferase-isomerase [Chloroflexota bacterium]